VPIDWDALVIGPVVSGPLGFGQPVTYTPAGGTACTISGVFDQEYNEQNPLGGMVEQLGMPGNITGTRPVLGVQLSAFPSGVAPAQGDALTTGGASYLVMEVRQDGHGWAKLLLNNGAAS
jgi:hypothetical protein